MDDTDPRAFLEDGLGADIRALRKAHGLTLSVVSERIGRSVGWLSQVERGLTEPGLADLRRLADLFDKPLSLFFGAPEAPLEERGRVVREGARRKLGSPAEGLTEELLSPDLTGSFEIVRSVFDPGAALPVPTRRATEEAGYLVEGRLDIWIEERGYRLEPGDSFRIRGELFRWRNPGTVPAIAIWVIAPPVY